MKIYKPSHQIVEFHQIVCISQKYFVLSQIHSIWLILLLVRPICQFIETALVYWC